MIEECVPLSDEVRLDASEIVLKESNDTVIRKRGNRRIFVCLIFVFMRSVLVDRSAIFVQETRNGFVHGCNTRFFLSVIVSLYMCAFT